MLLSPSSLSSSLCSQASPLSSASSSSRRNSPLSSGAEGNEGRLSQVKKNATQEDSASVSLFPSSSLFASNQDLDSYRAIPFTTAGEEGETEYDAGRRRETRGADVEDHSVSTVGPSSSSSSRSGAVNIASLGAIPSLSSLPCHPTALASEPSAEGSRKRESSAASQSSSSLAHRSSFQSQRAVAAARSSFHGSFHEHLQDCDYLGGYVGGDLFYGTKPSPSPTSSPFPGLEDVAKRVERNSKKKKGLREERFSSNAAEKVLLETGDDEALTSHYYAAVEEGSAEGSPGRERSTSKTLSPTSTLSQLEEEEKKIPSAHVWHTLDPETAALELSTDLQTGLPSAEVERRQETYGPNALENEKPPGLLTIFFMQFCNLIILLLAAASVAAFGIGHTAEGAAILFIILLNCSIATAQERHAGNALASLAKLSSTLCVVLRDGVKMSVDTESLVPGDVVLLVAGDIVPADLLLISAADLLVNEMVLTGESTDVRKSTVRSDGKGKKKADKDASSTKLLPPNMCFSSTIVAEGNARALVVETGMRTKVGKIAALLKGESSSSTRGAQPSSEAERKKRRHFRLIRNCWARFLRPFQEAKKKETPLQRGLHKLGVIIGVGAIILAVVVFVVGLLRGTRDPQNPDSPVAFTMLMISVAVAVSAIPAGLPMVVIICLTAGTVEMVKRHVIVRRLAAVEVLGSASIINTDKTGTLTQGKMTAVKLWADFQAFDVTGKGYTPEGDILIEGESQLVEDQEGKKKLGHQLLERMLTMAVLCSNTSLVRDKEEKEEMPPSRGGEQKAAAEGAGEEEAGDGPWNCIGNTSEAPLIVCAAKAGIWSRDVSPQNPRVAEIPFSSKRKLMATVHSFSSQKMTATHHDGSSVLRPLASSGDEGAKLLAVVKGAPGRLLEKCTRYLTSDGRIVPLSASHKAEILRFIEEMSSEALRVLAVAFRPLHRLPWKSQEREDMRMGGEEPLSADDKADLIAEDLVMAGMFASIDPERDGVKEAVEVAREAGVRTIMITGDYISTAVAIAKKIRIFPDEIRDPMGEGAARDCSDLSSDGEYLPNEEIDEITRSCYVFARATPEDKLVIVQSLRRQGFVSAMTGDGVNDAPALNEADIGCAMGITGTEVAKGAADMILTDDNFVSIVGAIERGRIIYQNIQKFVIFLLSTNLAEVLLILLATAIGMPIPLEPLQLLSLNLLSDGLPAVALSMEKGEPTVMKAKPRPKNQYIIHGKLWISLLLNAMAILLSTFMVYAVTLYLAGGHIVQDELLDFDQIEDPTYSPVCRRFTASDGWVDVAGSPDSGPSIEKIEPNCAQTAVQMARTATFISITVAEVFRAFTVRFFTRPVWYKFTENRYLHGAALASFAITALLVNTPGIMDVFNFHYLELWQWLFALSGSVLTLVLAEVIKAVLLRLIGDPSIST